MQSGLSLPQPPKQAKGPAVNLRLTCPVCDGDRMFRQRGDYLWVQCSCVESLPLPQRAQMAHEIHMLNHDAQQDFRANQERLRQQKRLGEELCRVLNAPTFTGNANWLPWGQPGGDRLFGPVEVDGLTFGLLFWEEAPEGDLVLIAGEKPHVVGSLPQLGAILAELAEAQGG